jgi:hypothetical protein
MAENLRPGRGQPQEPFALALDKAEAEFRLQLLEMLGDGRLHQVQSLGGATDAEVGLHQGDQGAKLPQIHIT